MTNLQLLFLKNHQAVPTQIKSSSARHMDLNKSVNKCINYPQIPVTPY